jgi:hypothetical protein
MSANITHIYAAGMTDQEKKTHPHRTGRTPGRYLHSRGLEGPAR